MDVKDLLKYNTFIRNKEIKLGGAYNLPYIWLQKKKASLKLPLNLAVKWKFAKNLCNICMIICIFER